MAIEGEELRGLYLRKALAYYKKKCDDGKPG
jgi:hypothetical protein